MAALKTSGQTAPPISGRELVGVPTALHCSLQSATSHDLLRSRTTAPLTGYVASQSHAARELQPS